MSFWFQVKRCVAALLGLTVALVGLALVLQLAALLLWQYGIALQKPSWPRLPIDLLFADHAKLASTALAPYLEYIPRLEWSWLANREDTSATHAVAVWLVNKVHIGVVPALLGVPLALGGWKLLLRQMRAVAGEMRRVSSAQVCAAMNQPIAPCATHATGGATIARQPGRVIATTAAAGK